MTKPILRAMLTALLFAGVLSPAPLLAQIVVLVNDEPITSYDVTQRQRWLARTSGFGERMQEALRSNAIRERFKELMVAAQPRSQAEAEAVAERIKKQLLDETRSRVMAQASAATRKAAIDSLIEDRLKIQAARKLSIIITDAEVAQVLAERAKGADGKGTLDTFYAQFEVDGINRRTIQEVIRAQLAWRDVIRRTYGARIQNVLAAVDAGDAEKGGELVFDAREVRLPVSGADQAVIAKRLVEAENLRERFTSCGELAKQVKLVPGSTMKSMPKAKLSDFPRESQPLVNRASDNQMTPPLVSGSSVVAYAICRKVRVADSKTRSAEDRPDQRQQEFERYSRRHLQDLKQSAALDFRGS
jgi:peptidyl-prolyl cis-trans isomerase SurA